MVVFESAVPRRHFIPFSSGSLCPSRYNVTVPLQEPGEGGLLIYNTMSGAAARLSPPETELLKAFHNGAVTASTIIKRLETISRLYECGFLVERSSDEPAQVMAERLFWRKTRQYLDLTIAPTLACNLYCSYCFQIKADRSFSEKDLRDTFDFCRKVITPETRVILLHWYGGEPTLRLEDIRYLSPRIGELAARHRASLHSEILTNAWNLTEESCRIYRSECDIRTLQISVDWPPEAFGDFRKLDNGFTHLLSRIELASHYFDLKLRIHCHTLNRGKVGDLLERLAQRGLNKTWEKRGTRLYVHFSMLYDFTDACRDVAKIKIRQDDWAKIQCDYLEKAEQLGFVVNWLPKRTIGKYCCAQCENAFLLVPGGDIYKCYRQNYTDRRVAVGNVTQEKIPYTVVEGEDATDRADCQDCLYLPICSGACPDSASARWLESPCTPLKGNLKRRIAKEWQKAKNRIEPEDGLNCV